jgi:UDP-N-acetylglucosamine--N-acetylmuramyl-(pentapeptide) pyrophosphoryl-undecaprenol N-acetylglucosamine transferase
MKVVFTGGGTCGHIFPIIAVVREMKKTYPDKDLRLFYIGPKDDYSLTILSQEGVKVKTILTGKLRRYFSLKNFLDLFKIPIGILQALFWLFFLAPDLVFSKGGYGSFPTTFAAKILHIPIFLHESDVVPGLASKIESKWALEIFTSFPKTEYFPKEKMICVGNPIRKEILKGDIREARKIFNLKGNKPLILVLGGSQGAQSINNIILEVLPEMLEDFEVIHQTGKRNYKQIKAQAEALIAREDLKRYYHPLPFLNETQLKHALTSCDFVVSRAGSGSLFEIAAARKPAILIPLPKAAQNHQLKNAYAFAKTGGGEVIEEQNLKPHFFLERIKYFFSRPDILEQMKNGSSDFARPKAAQIIANYVLEYLFQTTKR